MDGQTLRRYRECFRLTQRQVAEASGMRQPDVAAIEAGRRASPQAQRRVHEAIRSLARPSVALEREALRSELRLLLEQAGGRDVRLFGSVARGDDRPGSDVDVIATFPDGFDLFDVMELEERAERLLGIRVDIVSDDPRVSYALGQARRQAVPL